MSSDVISFDNSYEVILDNDYLNTPKSTDSKYANELAGGKSKIFITCLAGICTFTTTAETKNTMHFVDFTEPIENHAKYISEYNNNVDCNFTSFINELNKINSLNFTKNELITEILSFKSLNNNWDGYGAFPLEVQSASNVIELVNSIDEKLIGKVDEIYPNPNGTISLIWNNDSDETLSMDIGNKTMSYYIEYSLDDIEYFDNIKINRIEIDKISNFLSSLFVL